MKKNWQLSMLFLASCVALMLLSSSLTAGTSQPAQPASIETYSYDSAGRLTGVSYANGSGIEYSYDANGSILSVTVRAGDEIFEDGFE